MIAARTGGSRTQFIIVIYFMAKASGICGVDETDKFVIFNSIKSNEIIKQRLNADEQLYHTYYGPVFNEFVPGILSVDHVGAYLT